jgi:hypothetical protein
VKYVLVDKGDNIVSTVDLQWDVGLSGARTYFLGLKKIDKKEFNKLWRVMTETDQRRIKVNDETHREYEEFGSWLDIEKS